MQTIHHFEGTHESKQLHGPLQAKAMQLPSAMNNFKTKHLNEWVNADTAWMDMRSWDACADQDLDIESFAGQPCWVGLDLASKTDIAALVIRAMRHEKNFSRLNSRLPDSSMCHKRICMQVDIIKLGVEMVETAGPIGPVYKDALFLPNNGSN